MTETPNPTPEPDGEKWDTWYWKQAEQVQQDINSGTDSFDKSMLTLSSGALGVSLAVIKDIVPLNSASWLSLLYASWFAFALCIATTVVSFLFSIAAQKEHRELLDEVWTTKNHELAKREPSRSNKAVKACTRIALTLFLVGLACTIIFVVVNVSRLHAEDAQKMPDSATVTDVRNFYMSQPEKPLEKGRSPMKVVPPPPKPTPCPPK
jgi:hypothetical protein